MARNTNQAKKPAPKGTKNAKGAAEQKQQQNRREITAIAFIFAAIFSVICCFNTDAFLIKPVVSLISGLFGQPGRYILPVVLILSTVILFTSKNRPVRLRIGSAFSLILTVSALYHLIQNPEIHWEFRMIATLFQGGISGETGGLLGGFLAVLLKTGITIVGAYIVLILALLVQIITTMNMTVNSLITAIKNRPRAPKPEKEPQPELDPAERIVNHVAYKHIERVEKRRAAEFDLPVDDPPIQKQRQKKKARVPSPDEFLQEQRQAGYREPVQAPLEEVELRGPVEERATAQPETVAVPGILPEPAVLPGPVAMPEPAPDAAPEPVAPQPEPPKVTKQEAAASAAEIAQEIHAAGEGCPAGVYLPAGIAAASSPAGHGGRHQRNAGEFPAVGGCAAKLWHRTAYRGCDSRSLRYPL